MDSTNFQYVWNQWIAPLVDDLFRQMDERFVKHCNVSIRDIDAVGVDAEKYYQKIRLELKNRFYGNRECDNIDEHKMDFHKIAAILCRTLIKYKIFDFDVKKCQEYIEKYDKHSTKWAVRNSLVNYRLSFYVSVVFLYQSMIYYYKDSNPKMVEKLRENKKLDLYSNKSNNQDSFENCMIINLARRDIDVKSFDYFMYSIVMYQLEEYNKVILNG